MIGQYVSYRPSIITCPIEQVSIQRSGVTLIIPQIIIQNTHFFTFPDISSDVKCRSDIIVYYNWRCNITRLDRPYYSTNESYRLIPVVGLDAIRNFGMQVFAGECMVGLFGGWGFAGIPLACPHGVIVKCRNIN